MVLKIIIKYKLTLSNPGVEGRGNYKEKFGKGKMIWNSRPRGYSPSLRRVSKE
jgi:hypothetical protein